MELWHQTTGFAGKKFTGRSQERSPDLIPAFAGRILYRYHHLFFSALYQRRYISNYAGCLFNTKQIGQIFTVEFPLCELRGLIKSDVAPVNTYQ